MLYPLKSHLQLEKLYIHEEVGGNANPYLWAVFFTIDGLTTFIGENYMLQGKARLVITNVGDHGNLNAPNQGAGAIVAIPDQFGYGTILHPIPNRALPDWPKEGTMGCVVVLMQERETSDSAVAAGHSALRIAVEEALNQIIPELGFNNPDPAPQNIDDLQKQVADRVTDAIRRNVSLFDWLSAGGHMDRKIGSHIFTCSAADLMNAGPGGRLLNKIFIYNQTGPNPVVIKWEIRARAHAEGSKWEDLGGIKLNGSPAAASWGPDRIDCFARGENNHMWHKWLDGSAWSEWEDLGGPPAKPIVIHDLERQVVGVGPGEANHHSDKAITSAPAAVSWGPNRIDCFARGENNHMWHKWWDGSAWSVWEDLGGELKSAPAVCSWQENRLDCFVQGPNDHMWHKWWDGSAWSEWEDLGGILTEAPAATSWDPNRIDCFVRGTDTKMWHKRWDGSAWSEWEDLKGGLSSAPAAVSRNKGRVSLDCFVRGLDNHLWHMGRDGLAWKDWFDLGGILTAAPAAVSWAPNRVDCFIRGANGYMWHKWWGEGSNEPVADPGLPHGEVPAEGEADLP